MSRLGKYEIQRKLAAGGMAELYLARQSGPEGFSKNVVIKRLLPELTADEALVRMFLDEARIAARLNHTNIVQIYDLGAASGSYFIAMEYVHGRNLAELQHEEAALGAVTPPGLVAYVMSRMMRGLHYAHTLVDRDRGPLRIVHRDISPQNVLVSFQGEVKLLDFGIAKAASRAAETQAGLLKGKYGYMSPEQCRGDPVDHRSDIFSAGILLYELVCRRRLFRRTSDFATMRAVIEDPIPPPSAVHEDVPDELEQIIMRALIREPDQRYQSAQEVQIDLERALQANGWQVGPDQLASYLTRLFPGDLEQLPARVAAGEEVETADYLGGEATTEAASAPLRPLSVPGPREELSAEELSAEEPSVPDQPTVPGFRRPDPEVLKRAALTPLGEGGARASPSPVARLSSQELPTFTEAEEDETIIKPPDFDDIEEEPMSVEDGEAAMPGEDPLESQGDLEPTDVWPHSSGAQRSTESAPAASILNPDLVLQGEVAAAEEVTIDLPPDAAGERPSAPPPIPAGPIDARVQTAELSEPGVELELEEEDVEEEEGFPWGAAPSPPKPQAPDQHDAPPAAAPAPKVGGNRTVVLLLVIACVMVVVGAGLAVYILVLKRAPRVKGGTISLVTEPPGASVYLNGEKHFGSTPTTLYGVPLGKENLIVVLATGHKPWRKRLRLDSGTERRSVKIKLESTATGGPAGTLVVSVREEGARVYLDGEFKGVAPLTVDSVTSGVDHELVVKKPGFEDKALRVEALGARERRRIVVGLRPAEKGELEQGVERRRKHGRGGGSTGPVEIPRARSELPPLGGDDIGERVPESKQRRRKKRRQR